MVRLIGAGSGISGPNFHPADPWPYNMASLSAGRVTNGQVIFDTFGPQYAPRSIADDLRGPLRAQNRHCAHADDQVTAPIQATLR